MTKDEFIRRFIQNMRDYGVCQEAMTDYVPQAAEACYEVWADPEEGLQDQSPEDMAEGDRDCWE